MFTIDEQLRSYVGLSDEAVNVIRRRELSECELQAISSLTNQIRAGQVLDTNNQDLAHLTSKIIEQRESAYSDLDKEFLQFIVIFALKGYSHKVRKSGNLPYFVHPHRVAKLLSWIPTSYISIIGGLLHDLVEERESVDRPERDKWNDWFKGVIENFRREYVLFSEELFAQIGYTDFKFKEGLETCCEIIARMTRRPREKEIYFLYLNELLGVGQGRRKMNSAARESIGIAANIKLMDRIDNSIDLYQSIIEGDEQFTIDKVNYAGFKNLYYWNLVESKLRRISEENRESAQFQHLKQIKELLRQVSSFMLHGVVEYYDQNDRIPSSEREKIKRKVLHYLDTADATKINPPEYGNEFEGTVTGVYLPAFKGEKQAYRERPFLVQYRDAFLFGEYFRQRKQIPSLLGIKHL